VTTKDSQIALLSQQLEEYDKQLEYRTPKGDKKFAQKYWVRVKHTTHDYRENRQMQTSVLESVKIILWYPCNTFHSLRWPPPSGWKVSFIGHCMRECVVTVISLITHGSLNKSTEHVCGRARTDPNIR
jgi:hypothetical protein